MTETKEAPASAARLDHERKLIEEARAETRQGLYIDAAEFEAWLDTYGSDEDLPPPQPKSHP